MKNFTDLTGRKAIVTGGTRGLGYGMAEGLMEAGAEVVIVGSSAKAEAVADEKRIFVSWSNCKSGRCQRSCKRI